MFIKDYNEFFFIFQIVFLQDERFVEFHSQFGRYYRTRIPKYGRDLAYHTASCDMYFVGVGYEVFIFSIFLFYHIGYMSRAYNG